MAFTPFYSLERLVITHEKEFKKFEDLVMLEIEAGNESLDEFLNSSEVDKILEFYYTKYNRSNPAFFDRRIVIKDCSVEIKQAFLNLD